MITLISTLTYHHNPILSPEFIFRNYDDITYDDEPIQTHLDNICNPRLNQVYKEINELEQIRLYKDFTEKDKKVYPDGIVEDKKVYPDGIVDVYRYNLQDYKQPNIIFNNISLVHSSPDINCSVNPDFSVNPKILRENVINKNENGTAQETIYYDTCNGFTPANGIQGYLSQNRIILSIEFNAIPISKLSMPCFQENTGFSKTPNIISNFIKPTVEFTEFNLNHTNFDAALDKFKADPGITVGERILVRNLGGKYKKHRINHKRSKKRKYSKKSKRRKSKHRKSRRYKK